MTSPKIFVVGNVGKDPVFGTTPNGKDNLKFAVAANRKDRDGNDITTWYNVTLWGKDATFWSDKLVKGDKLLVVGEHEFRTYAKNDGSQGFSNDVGGFNVTIDRLVSKQQSAQADPTDIDELPF